MSVWGGGWVIRTLVVQTIIKKTFDAGFLSTRCAAMPRRAGAEEETQNAGTSPSYGPQTPKKE